MVPASLVDLCQNLTYSINFICIGEARETKDLSTPLTDTGLTIAIASFSSLIYVILIYAHSYDGELHLVHYKSTYDNISAAIADNQTDSLAVVGIFLREADVWDQWKSGRDAESILNLKNAALGLSRNWKGPMAPKLDMEIVLDQLVSSIT